MIDDKFKFGFAKSSKVKLNLSPDFKATGTKSDGSSVSGTWQPIYSQGFFAELSDGNRYIATSFRYNLKGGATTENIKKVVNDRNGFDQVGNKFFDSVCDQTMVGIVQPVQSTSSSMSQF